MIKENISFSCAAELVKFNPKNKKALIHEMYRFYYVVKGLHSKKDRDTSHITHYARFDSYQEAEKELKQND